MYCMSRDVINERSITVVLAVSLPSSIFIFDSYEAARDSGYSGHRHTNPEIEKDVQRRSMYGVNARERIFAYDVCYNKNWLRGNSN